MKVAEYPGGNVCYAIPRLIFQLPYFIFFNRQITPIVREVMEARGAGIVLDAGAAQLVLPAYNATDEVIERLNQRLRTISVTRQSAPPPQQQPAQ